MTTRPRIALFCLSPLLLSASLHCAAQPAYEWDSVAIGGGGFVSGIITTPGQKDLLYIRTDVGGAYRWDVKAGRWIALNDWVSDSETGLLGIESLAVDPRAPNKVYMTAGIAYQNQGRSAVLKSTDYGKTFTKVDITSQFKVHGNGMGRNGGEKLQVDPANGEVLYAGTRANGLFKSLDGAQSWRRVDSLPVTTTPNGNGIGFVVLDPGSARDGATQRIIVGVSRYGTVGPNLYLSKDGGKSFAPVPGAPQDLMPNRAVLADGHLLITYANGAGPWGDKTGPEPMNQGGVWKLHLDSGRWTEITPPKAWAYGGISVDRANPKRMVVSTINFYDKPPTRGDKIFYTKDGGATWTDVFARGFELDPNGVSWIATSFIHWTGSIEFDPSDPKSVMVVSGNGLFRTRDIEAAPSRWSFHVNGIEETVPLNLVSIPGGPALVSAIGDYDGFRHTDVTRYAPIHKPTMGTTWGLDYARRQPSRMVRVGNAMYVSGDMGVTWNRTAALHGKQGQVAISADGKTILHTPERSPVTYLTRDDGTTWTPVAGLEVAGARPVADSVNPARFYALAGARMLVSSDGGASFKPGGTLPSPKGSRIVRTAPEREGDVWVALHQGGLARSTDAGASFATIGNVSHATAVGFGKAAPARSYPTVYIWGTVDGVRGLFCSPDEGRKWTRINDDAHQFGGPGNGQAVIGDMNTHGVVYMTTAGRGIVYGKPRAGTAACQ